MKKVYIAGFFIVSFLVPQVSLAITQYEYDSIVQSLGLSQSQTLVLQKFLTDRPSSKNRDYINTADYGISKINSQKSTAQFYGDDSFDIAVKDKKVTVSYTSRPDSATCTVIVYNSYDTGKLTRLTNQAPNGEVTIDLPPGEVGQYDTVTLSCYDKQQNILTSDFVYLTIKDKVKKQKLESKVKISSPKGGLFGTEMDKPIEIKWSNKSAAVTEVALVYVGPIDGAIASYSEDTVVVLQSYSEDEPNTKGVYNFYPSLNTYDGEWYIQIRVSGESEFIKSKKTIKISSKG